jgi:hypothetical protein
MAARQEVSHPPQRPVGGIAPASSAELPVSFILRRCARAEKASRPTGGFLLLPEEPRWIIAPNYQARSFGPIWP